MSVILFFKYKGESASVNISNISVCRYKLSHRFQNLIDKLSTYELMSGELSLFLKLKREISLLLGW